MTLLHCQILKSFVVLSLAYTLLLSSIVAPPVYAQSQSQAPATHVSDTAGVVHETTRQQLENILANLQQRSGVNFVVLTVQTTAGVEIFDYSAKVARDWNVGVLAATGKSLLLVVAVDEKTSRIQASRLVRRDFPEGLLADTNEVMRGPVSSGQVGEALLLGVQKIVSALAGRLSFSADGMDQPPPVEATATTSAAAAGNTVEVPVIAQPKPAPIEEARPTATPAPANDDSKAISDTGSQISDPKSSSSNPVARRREPASETAKNSAARAAKKSTPQDDEADAAYVVETLADKLPLRIEKLTNFIATHPDSKSKAQATELLIVARAALGDEKLKAGERAAGVELLFRALSDAQPDMSDKLFSGVVAQIPLNLYLRGEGLAAVKAAQQIEAKVANNAKRLLALSGFYLEIERGDEAARIAELAVKLAPDVAETRNALALALHISLRLDEAATEYKHALDLDPKTRGARRALADLNRAAGKFDEALVLYRAQLLAQPDDKPARVGLVICLFELNKIDEAKERLQAVIKDDPRDMLMLTGAAYWLVAHGESALALALAQKAVEIEPRYTWAQIALSRSLIAQRQPLHSERSIRYARQYGKFPTLEYELASTLASLGLYEEASQTLLASFTLKDGQIETLLANRIPARAASFPELLSLERRASIFQPTAADTEDNARVLKALLAFTVAMNPQGADAKIDEAGAIAAAREFAAGSDDMRVYRQLYAASRLLQRGVALQTALELSDVARSGVDAAILVPAVTVAVQADELASIRARAIAAGGTPDIPDAPRNVLANILRGRIEDLSGWALFNLDKTAEAVENLRRAVGILPAGTPLWQTASWHLGVALQQGGNDADALGFYIKSYNTGAPDPARRSVIEQLYKKINGSLDGLNDRIGPASLATTTPPASNLEKSTAPLAEASPTPGPTPTPEPAPAQPSPSPEPTPPDPSPTPTPEPSRSPEPTPAPESSTPQATPTPDATQAAQPATSPTPSPEPSPTPVPTPESTPRDPGAPVPSSIPPSGGRPRRVKPPR